ncbi:NAD(P)H-hydrate dehydratase [Massilia yuzhufengensis]|uniref:ADP-dependent (S)-NAD(P)H-hydrate dehydratase n=1 Tax=Massilia yuzhufengensis TaxID=1164594 RepID=A0A1I1K8L7_9BURK|nr:NAD(P)H-hydrate dehydratase [Massilia yuzhufengensis]SFC54473.1 yjeF C-terminal region, hydroxyethylthiazole kinase-related [Massilia yuzhufengensis]
MDTPFHANAVHDVDTALLRSWPVAMPAVEGDKEIRGHVLVVGGSAEMPGAVILAATAALRAGAGKLTIATGQSVAQLVALAMPEARVIGLAEHATDGFSMAAFACLDRLAERVDAVLIGPGMCDEPATAELVHALLPRFMQAGTSVVLDACAMGALLHPPAAWPAGQPMRFERPLILTPHAGEMAHLTGIAKQDICALPDPRAVEAARAWNAVIALKGARTVIATPDGTLYQHEGGNVGLAISGSGDVLAGIIAGLAARGAPLDQAACWGVALHARAGERLAERMGTLGYLAREISQEIPALLEQVAGIRGGDTETIRPTPVGWGMDG